MSQFDPAGQPQPSYPQQPPGAYPQEQPPAGYQPAGYPPQAYGGAPVAGPPGTWFDQASGLWLPNGTELASSGRRIGGWFLGGVLMVVTLFIGYVIWSFVIYGRGQTPKMQVLGMRCYKPAEGRVAGWGDMALREIVGIFLLDYITSGLIRIVGLILMLTRSDRKALQDLIAGTVVLYDPNKVLAPAA